MRRLTITVALLGLLLVPASALAATQTASRGGVTATLSYHGKYPRYTGMRMTISEHGTVVYDQPVKASGCETPYCGPADAQGRSVHVLSLEGNGKLAVVLELFSEGAHCCFYDQVFSPTATGGYTVTTRDFGDPGASLKDLSHDGRTEFVSANDAFAYTFTDFAESGLPIQIFTFGAGRFVDVTRHYPKLIRRDAAIWWKAYRQDTYPGRRGLIAAWAADEYNLGRRAAADRTLNREVRARHITAHFVSRLRTFLKRHGYAR